jgi:hypothetical protein
MGIFEAKMVSDKHTLQRRSVLVLVPCDENQAKAI